MEKSMSVSSTLASHTGAEFANTLKKRELGDEPEHIDRRKFSSSSSTTGPGSKPVVIMDEEAGFAGAAHRDEDLDAKTAYFTKYPNKWAYYRSRYLRDFASEFLGVMVLIVFGAGVDCQVVLSGDSTQVAPSAKGSYLSISFGWAVGTALGVWVASASGGHINPAVTLCLAIFRGFPWRKVPLYIIAQLLGGLVGGLLVYGNYYHAIVIVDPEKTQATASLFTTYALDYLPQVACFFSEFLGTAILLIVVLAIGDKSNGPPPQGLAPLVLFITILGEGASLGMQTAYAINPARDLGPRLALWIVGYSRTVLFSYRNQYWLWTPILGPIFGSIAGTIIYDLFMFNGSESIFNRPSREAREHHAMANKEQRPVIGNGLDAV